MSKQVSRSGLTELRDNTVLRRVSQLGSARSGLDEWRLQRLSAIMLIPLALYFVASVLHLVTSPRTKAAEWLGSPVNSLLMLLVVVAVALHAFVGLRSIFSDYVHAKSSLLIANLLTRVAVIVLATAGCLAILEAFVRQGNLR